MNPIEPLSVWWQFFGVVALETVLVFLVGCALHRITQSAFWQRTIWQAAMLGLLLLLVCEFTGMSREIVVLAKATNQRKRQPIAVEVARISPSVLEEAVWMEAPEISPAMPAQIPAQSSRKSLAAWEGIVWMLGFVLLITKAGLARLLFLRFQRRGRMTNNKALAARVQSLAGRLRLQRTIRVTEARDLHGPIAFGIFRAEIGLPEGFCTHFTRTQQDAMLVHELAHLAAHDPAWYWLSDVVTALLWWHPLAWWSRRKLQAASEAAADEASVLLENGPDLLAQCLVQLAQHLTRRQARGWLGVAGASGFRSGLGRRVARLIHLNGHQWRPVNRLGSSLAKTTAPAVLAIAVIACTAWALPYTGQTWRDSVAGLALSALLEDGEEREAAADEPSRSGDAANQVSAKSITTLIQDARLFYEQGKLDQAEALLDQVLKSEPNHPAALQYLKLIQEKKQLESLPNEQPAAKRSALQPVPPTKEAPANQAQPVLKDASKSPSAQPVVNQTSQAGLTPPSKGRQSIQAKLDQIVLDEIGFDGWPSLGDVIKVLHEKSRQNDPGLRGVNFILNNANDSPLQNIPATGLATTVHSVGQVMVRIHPPLRRVTLRAVLDAIVKTADHPLQYSVEDYAVVFSHKIEERPPLFTRWFKVDPNTFRPALAAAAGAPAGLGSERVRDEPVLQLRQFLASLDVDLSAPQKSLFFNDRSGQLMVRATRQELDRIEPLIRRLNAVPQQLVLETRIAEVTEEIADAQFSDWFSNNFLGGQKTNRHVIGASVSTNTLDRFGTTNSLVWTFTGILTPAQFALAIRALEQRSRVDLLTPPKISTLSGRQTQVKVVDVRYIVTDLSAQTNGANNSKASDVVSFLPIPEPFEVGPVIDVVPHVRSDGYSVHITVIPSIKEFLGYDDDTHRANKKIRDGDGDSKPVRLASPPQPVPIFRLRQIVASATLWDGHTVVVGGETFDEQRTKDKVPVLGDLPLAGRLFRNESVKRVRKHLLFFITPRLIDPAGNTIHTDDEILRKGTPLP